MRWSRLLGITLLCPGLLCLAMSARADGVFDTLDLQIGRRLFDRIWLPAPASTRADDGLGPLFDARSCGSCHRAAGRATVAVNADDTVEGRGVVLFLGRPDGSPDPVYGRRMQIDAVPGLRPEGVLGAHDTTLADGRRTRVPVLTDLAYGPLDRATGKSLRVAPDLRGRGAIDRVPDAALLAIEAEQVGSVHGRARRVALADGRDAVGRFGWKASQTTLAAQAAEAFSLDLGLSTAHHPEPWGDCTPNQPACRSAPHGGETAVEIPAEVLDRIVAYLAALTLPLAPRDAKGERLFAASGCTSCHRPLLPTEDGAAARLFSDLLLHDMGLGLADTMPEPGAAASEWRTAPLVGLSDALARNTGLLHDGRARSAEEAVSWHGGQAIDSVRRFHSLPSPDRAALLRFVSSL